MRAAPQTAHVHAGAHCAGAEAFQRFLSANRAALGALGVGLAYPGRDGAAGGNFDAAFPDPRHEGTALAAFPDAIAAALDGALGRVGPLARLLISEQDLAGRMAGLMEGRFYPAAGKRAAALRAAIGRPVDRLVVVVRPYDRLFLGAWRAFALDRKIDPFDDYAPAMAGFPGGWVDVVCALRDGLEAHHVTVLAARPEPEALLAHLLPGPGLAAPVRPAQVPGITDSAIAMVQRHLGQGARFAPGQRDRILAFHARQPQIPASYGFAGLALADLRGRYVADLDTLSRLPGVDLVGNLLPAMAAE